MSTTIDSPTVAGAAPSPQSGFQPGLAYYARKTAKALASLQLTVILFAFSILLVFFGTIAQMDNGIWTVVDKYFWSWVVMVPMDLFHKFFGVFLAEQVSKDTAPWSGSFPLPAGKLLGGAMLINLLAAHALRFRLTWKRAGIILLHSGLILLFVGEFITREYAVEQRMSIDEGKSLNYTEDIRKYELAIIDHSDAATDSVSAIPSSLLHTGSRLTSQELPVDVEVIQYMANSKVKDAEPGKNPATAGLAVKPRTAFVAVEQPVVSGVDTNQMDIPAAYVRLYRKGTNESLGTFLVSLLYTMQSLSNEFELDGKRFELTLRFKRTYQDYSIHLVKFHFDRYPGTQKPKNYSSDVIVYDKTGEEVRRQTIRMNEPMRYAGETFYQQGFDRSETATTLQVVKNPGWIIPYVSCVMVGLGLIVHFLIGLVGFLTRKVRPNPTRITEPSIAASETESIQAGWLERNFEWLVPAVLTAVAVLYLGSVYGRMKPKDQYNLDAYSKLPVLEGGRVKPLDSVARVYLRKISHQSVFKDAQGVEQPAIRWYLDTLGAKIGDKDEPAWSYPIVRIENDQVLETLKLAPRDGLRYSINELYPHIDEIQMKSEAARMKRAAKKSLDAFETKMIDLEEKMALVLHVAQGKGHDTEEKTFEIVPPQKDGASWESLGNYRTAAENAAFQQFVAAARNRVRAKFTDEDARRILGKAGAGATPEELREVKQVLLEVPISELRQGGPKRFTEVLRALMNEIPKSEQDELQGQMEADIQARMNADPAIAHWQKMIEARHSKKPDQFNALLDDYRTKYLNHIPDSDLRRTSVEINYNRFSPFLRCIGLYVMAFVLGVLGFAFKAAEWPRLGEALRRSALFVLMVTFLVHLAGLIVRMDLMNYTLVFVTNLYSSAVFIGCGCVALGIILEMVFPIGIANIVGSVLGVATTIVAHNIATEDTLEMMQAVLDTNFWLATHVTTVTLGYTATFVAGFLGAAYVFLMFCTVIRDSFRTPGQPAVDRLIAYGAAAAGIAVIPLSVGWVLFDALGKFEVLPLGLSELLRYGLIAVGGVYFIILLGARATAEGVDSHGQPVSVPVPRFAQPITGMALDPHIAKILGQMIYGVLCFATMLSFIGTVLGGIWADQSWGRFWGWDPKENGAVLIVLWNALILHARWCGLVKTRGMAVLAVVGNMITAWSWFGTNQLGIGLHAYGFDTRLADGCFNFWLSMGMIVALGLIPQQYWSATSQPLAVKTTLPEASTNGPRPQGERKLGRKRR
jgi:ABC-type transport system involved in cytochrome c biogenesis permease subunit